MSESVKACKSLPKVSAMNKPIKFDLSVKYPWDRVKTIAAVHIYIDDRMTKWRLIVQNTSGIVKFSVNSSFFGGFNPRQILIEKKVYNFKGNNLYSDIIESNQILGESYDIDDYMIDESALKQLGYEKPDDLTIVCCFKVLPNYGTFVSIDDDFEIHRGDFDLICSDGQKVKVHKNVISNQSAALKRQLKRSSSEVESCKAMKIMYPSEVVREIVRYVYTGNLNRVEGKERELLQIAAEFQIKGVAVECEQFVSDSLTPGNVIETMIMAEQRKSEFLKTATMKFCVQNFKEVKQTEGWKLLSNHPALMMHLLESINQVA